MFNKFSQYFLHLLWSFWIKTRFTCPVQAIFFFQGGVRRSYDPSLKIARAKMIHQRGLISSRLISARYEQCNLKCGARCGGGGEGCSTVRALAISFPVETRGAMNSTSYALRAPEMSIGGRWIDRRQIEITIHPFRIEMAMRLIRRTELERKWTGALLIPLPPVISRDSKKVSHLRAESQ